MSVIRKILGAKKISTKFISPVATYRKNYSNNASEFILHSNLPDVDIPKVSIDEHLFGKTDKWHHRIAAECAVTGRKYTYEEVRTKATNLNRHLRKKLKLQKGDVISILLSNSPEYIIVTTGALKAGLVVTTLNPIYTPDEIARQLKDSSAKAIVTFVDLFELAKASRNLAKQQIDILTIKTKRDQATPAGALNFDEFTENVDYPDLLPSNDSDVALLPYSSGTTGLPKGVELTHKNIVANCCQFNDKPVAVIHETTNDHQDIVPVVLPQFHIYGLVAATLSCFSTGVRSVCIDKFTPDIYVTTLKKYKPHVLMVAPPLVLFLTGHPSVTSKDLESVRTVLCGAAPMGSLDEEKFLQKAQKKIDMLQGYGLTETSPLVTMKTAAMKNSPTAGGSIGRPVSRTSIKIVDPDDPSETPLGPNKIGEVLIKGPQVMKGYHNNAEETKNTFSQDGWLKTGDTMYYTDDKLLFVSARLKELIKVKGFQVPPAELEEIIRHFPDVEDAAVIGIPHSTQGEIPRAYIVQKAGKHVNVQKLNEFVSNKVAPYKQLRGGIEVVETIPKNASGKIMRKALREQYEKNN